MLPEIVLPDKRTKRPSKPQSMKPQKNKHIRMLFGDPLDFTSAINEFKIKFPGMF